MTSEILNRALLVDAQEKLTDRHLVVESQEWDEINDLAGRIYMPYRVQPSARCSRPDAKLYAANVGRLVLSRFTFGTDLTVFDLSPEAGNGMVLTTLAGGAVHRVPGQAEQVTGAGEALLVDNSRTEYAVDFTRDHLQLNIVFSHDVLADLHLRWYGAAADDQLWSRQVKFPTPDTGWAALLSYASQCVKNTPEQMQDGLLGRHLEESICMHMLMQLRGARGLDNYRATPRLAPVHVRRAEEFMREHAQDAPTLSEIASVVNVSVRSLNRAFAEFRGYTPMTFLRAERLQGVRASLITADSAHTVAAIAATWGYSNFGLFAVNYKRRFGESPSQTLHRLRHH